MKTYSRRKKGKRDRLPKEELIGIIFVFVSITIPVVSYFICFDIYSKNVMAEYFYYESIESKIVAFIC